MKSSVVGTSDSCKSTLVEQFAVALDAPYITLEQPYGIF